MANPTIDPVPVGHWTLRDEAAQRRSSPRYASKTHCRKSMNESHRIDLLLQELIDQPRTPFPESRGRLDAPKVPGVYIICSKRGRALYVGRTHCKGGLHQRLQGHLSGRSVFARNLPIGPASLRTGFFFRCLPVKNHKTRALLEHAAVGRLCPKHLGLGLRARGATGA